MQELQLGNLKGIAELSGSLVKSSAPALVLLYLELESTQTDLPETSHRSPRGNYCTCCPYQTCDGILGFPLPRASTAKRKFDETLQQELTARALSNVAPVDSFQA